MRSAEWGADYWLESDWLRELAWRDFYRQLLIQFPAINKHKPFKADTDQIRWQQNDAHWQAWCTGRTGFPIIDAAMRQLLQTGWMHNRLRMLTASFLTKLLFQDWRRGEAFFMQHLVDGDFAANNGGWQWSASVGCDAAPYFRVFNPLRQSEKFDPEGLFIRRFYRNWHHWMTRPFTTRVANSGKIAAILRRSSTIRPPGSMPLTLSSSSDFTCRQPHPTWLTEEG
ncbi:FAD-binding domain-containing protein [Aliamphritea spongicola]|nr:FAD-binding domain-containing protein [Aliamphritea spongicola]